MFRIALSPDGDMHIDTLRVALFNFIAATQANKKLHIRLQDTNQEALDILALFGIDCSEISYQSHNLKFHQQLATKLLMDKNAFSCFCTPAQLEEEAPYDDRCRYLSDEAVLNNENPFTVRIKRPDEDINFDDLIQGKIEIDKEQIDSFLILHTDKSPTDTFALAIDDMLSDISMLIVEENQRILTAKQILIRHYLGYDRAITYAHLPPIPQEGNVSVKSLLEEGFLPSAITNYLIMIGNETPKEIFTLQEAFSWFELKNISKTPAAFDIERLRDINREHIKQTPAQELAKYLGYSSKDLGELAKIYTQEGSTINEIKPKIDAIFAPKEPSEHKDAFHILAKLIKEAPFFKEFEAFKAHLSQESGLQDDALLKPLSVLLTGATEGPNLADIYPHIKNYLGEIIK